MFAIPVVLAVIIAYFFHHSTVSFCVLKMFSSFSVLTGDSLGIIGAADGPSTIFISSSLYGITAYSILTVVLLLFLFKFLFKKITPLIISNIGLFSLIIGSTIVAYFLYVFLISLFYLVALFYF